MKKNNTLILLGASLLLLAACHRKDAGKIEGPARYAWDKFSMGADLSYVNQVEDYGGVYKDSGTVKDVFEIFRSYGANTVRVRLWHTPAWVAGLNSGTYYSDLYSAEKTIRRARQAGMAVNLDIHYSDRWADPHHQDKPAAWASLGFDVLKDSVYQYTIRVLQYLQSKNLVPEMVQIGNENNNGMLWPDGKTDTPQGWPNFAALLNSGIKAVRDFAAGSAIKPKIILHVAQLQDAAPWVQRLKEYQVTDYDILGLSHYVKWSEMPAMQDVTSNIKALKQFTGKQVMVVETAYPWTGENADGYVNIISATDTLAGYPCSPQGQLSYMKDLVQAIINGGGSGVMYWEPAWITSSLNDGWGIGSSWENNCFFDFSGHTLPVITYMQQHYSFP